MTDADDILAELDEDGRRRVKFTPAEAITSERVRWLWRDRIPLRGITVVAGSKGLGKSLLTNARLPAEASRGMIAGELEGQPIDVLVASAEDDWKSVVKPRLVAFGADLTRVHRVEVSDGDGEQLLTLPDDATALEHAVLKHRQDGHRIGMLVIDPIGAFLSQGTDTHRDASVRRALAPIAALAERLDLVVIVVAHLTKDEGTRLINRVSGAGAFVNAARSVLVLARDPDDPDGEQGTQRVLVHVGSNWGRYAPTLAANVTGRDVKLDDGTHTSIGYLDITGETDIDVDDLQRGRDDNASDDVEEAIGHALRDGPRPSREVKAQIASELECGKRTIERAAKRMQQRDELTITSGGYPRTTTWKLASSDTTPTPVATTTNLRRVATDRSDVVTGDLAFSSDSGDSPHSTVATGGRALAELTDAELFDQFPDSTIEQAA